MKVVSVRRWYSADNAQRLMSFALVLIGVIAVVDAFLIPDIGLGYLFLLPLGITAAFLSRAQIFAISAICTAFAEAFAGASEGPERILRVVFIFVVYVFIGLLVRDMVLYRRAASKRLAELEIELSHLHGEHRLLQLLVNSTDLAMITASEQGIILDCNRAAHEVLAVGLGDLVGRSLKNFLQPDDQDHSSCHGATEKVGVTANGKKFKARVWCSEFSWQGALVRSIVLEPVSAIEQRYVNATESGNSGA
jgi:PAS domain S-box-containing protein